MILTSVNVNLTAYDNKSVAIAMMNFWRYQYDKSRDELAHKRSLLTGAIQANKFYEYETKNRRQERDDHLGFSSYTNEKPPHSALDMVRLQKDVEAAQTNATEIQAMYDYYMTYIFDNIEHKPKCPN